MQAVTTIGLDIAKSVFQVHGIDAAGNVIVRQQLRRARVLPFFKKLSPCVVGIEACASSHHWSRVWVSPKYRCRAVVLSVRGPSTFISMRYARSARRSTSNPVTCSLARRAV